MEWRHALRNFSRFCIFFFIIFLPQSNKKLFMYQCCNFRRGISGSVIKNSKSMTQCPVIKTLWKTSFLVCDTTFLLFARTTLFQSASFLCNWHLPAETGCRKCKGGAVRCWHGNKPAVRPLFLIHVSDWHAEFRIQSHPRKPTSLMAYYRTRCRVYIILSLHLLSLSSHFSPVD